MSTSYFSSRRPLLCSLLLLFSNSHIVSPLYLTIPSQRRRWQPFSVLYSSSSSSKPPSEPAAVVDMNVYNVPYETAVEQWTAELLPQTAMQEEGIYLGVRDKKNIMADTVSCLIRKAPSTNSGGLGIELFEIAGGRQDGVGITIVSGLVPGGNAAATAAACILPGDSLVSLEVLDPQGKVFFDPIVTECLGYDKTVEAIASQLPSDWQIIKVTVKRLRRKPKVTVELQFPQDEPVSIEIFAGENLRRAMLVRGVKLNDELARRFDSGGSGNCGAEGTCATCVVSVVQGAHLLSPQGLQEQQILQKNPRWRMACKATVGYRQQEGQLKIRINPRQWV